MLAEFGQTPLRVLCLEDSPRDAEIMTELLSDGGFDVHLSLAANRAEFLDLLTAEPYDVILADYGLPDFDAPSALRAVQTARLSVPFICVSGSIGEEQAVALLKLGAADYVLKDRLGRLAIAVSNAIGSEAERVALKASQERFQHLFEHMADAVLLHDDAVILANPSANRDFGFPPDTSMEGVPLDALVHPDSLSEAHAAMDQLRGRGALSWVGPFELKLVRLDGKDWVAEAIIAAIASNGRIMFESTLRDLTERRRHADELDAYRTQLEILLEERERSLAAARSALASVTAVISRTVDIRDPYTAGHQRRVADLSTAIARDLKLDDAAVEEISVAAGLHDIGKISIPAEILSKPARLTGPEFELVKSHSQAGYDIIASAELTGVVPEIVLQHHERCDGSGYPRGLTGDQLLVGAKIIMVADVVEAMSSHRPYRKALGIDAARAEIAAGVGVLFDAAVVRSCENVIDAGFAFEDSPW